MAPEGNIAMVEMDKSLEKAVGNGSNGHSDTSSESHMTNKTFDANFNAPIYPPKAQQTRDRALAALTQFVQFCYLGWRWTRFCTVPSTWWISVPFILAESFIVFCGSFITYFLVWNQCDRPKLRLKELGIAPVDFPTVDVMVPCYNEPVEIVRATLLACLEMDYPQEKVCIVVCDDGNSAAMRALVAQINADKGDNAMTLRYVARKKIPGVPHHAKAGNINNALMNENTNGEFILVFDCDMVCKPYILQAILPHFHKFENDTFLIDEHVAMVQTPQGFTNVPENDPLGQQYRYFYGPVLKGWDSMGSSPCCGTNVMFSRKALLGVGGFTYGSITEDFLTSMTLNNAGYQTKYIHEHLAHGLSPETVHDFYKQRMRWAAGGLQIFVKNNALTKSGLPPVQKFLYFWSGWSTMLSMCMLFLILCPIIYLFGMGTIKVATFDTYEYFAAFCPYMFLQVACMVVSYRGVPSIYRTRSFQESVFMIPCYCRCVGTVLFGLKLGFKVTNKDAEASEFRKSFNWCIPFFVYYFFASIALGMSVLNITAEFRSGHPDPGTTISTFVSIFWICLIMWQMWPPISVLFTTLDRAEQLEKEKAAALANGGDESV